MPIIPDAPLRRVTLNLYDRDIALAERLYGYGWSAHLRALWHTHLTFASVSSRPRTIEDIARDSE